MKDFRNTVRFWSMVTAALAAVSCQMGETDIDGNGDPVGTQYKEIVLDAYQEDGTRTELSGTSVLWSPGDAVSILLGASASRLESTGASASAGTTFSGNLAVDVSACHNGDAVWGVYPYSSDISLSGSYVTTTLPSVQTAKAGSFANGLMLLLGKTALTTANMSQSTVQLSMNFKNVCSGVRFKVTRSGIKTVTMTADGGEALCGTVQLGMDGNGTPFVHAVTNPSSTIEVNAPGGGTFSTNTWYYIVTLPVESPSSLSQGVTFTATTATQEGTRSFSTSFNLNRGTFRKVSDLDGNMTMEDLEVEVQVAAPDTWVAEDELQRRVMPSNPSAPRANKEVVMMYWPWHETVQVAYNNVVNISTVVQSHPEALQDYSSLLWGQEGQVYFWGQPLFGYYRTTDPWVLRKHAEMLADAGVDAVMFDLSNSIYTWWSSVTQLLATWEQARLQGVNVPKIAFMSHLTPPDAEAAAQIRAIYDVLYEPGLYEDLWFKVDGHPILMAFPACLDFNPTAKDAAIRSFFTWRPGQYDYVAGPNSLVYTPDPGEVVPPQWGWLQIYPQHAFNNNEQVPVGVAQNACPTSGGHFYAFNVKDSQGNYTAYGRSYTADPATYHDRSDNGAFVWGHNFQQQWNRAISLDPHYIFVTGWNEWISLKFRRWPTSQTDPNYGYSPVAFADTFDWEHSRDIEPTLDWGDYGDSYYYQLTKNIRTFKGVSAYPNVSRKETVPIDGNFTEWAHVSPDFKHYAGNTMSRSHDGHGSEHYTNTTGRNDIVDAKVTRDADYVYFYVETAANITSYSGASWMRLLINKDMSWRSGWKGYDYCLNLETPQSSTVGYVSQCTSTTSEWSWTRLQTFDYRVAGNKMELRIPRNLFPSGKLDFAFKWADNNLSDSPAGGETRILNLYVDGDAAPGGRFNFHYVEP